LPSGRKHYRLTLADALSAHDQALTYGGLPGVRDLSLVQSALGRPYSGYYRAIHQKAAALVDSMSKNHGFVDGNKRTTLLLLHTFVVRSGYSIESMQGEDLNKAIEDMILDVVTRKMTALDAVTWFKTRLRRS
jgi:death-on-curing protein